MFLLLSVMESVTRVKVWEAAMAAPNLELKNLYTLLITTIFNRLVQIKI